eukprot:TRINITY_DN2347_c0_g1_i1.p3 TRINITY_DN2347_c0_g1~~TRINITY_DN2347_c0_g1_i1.p3  ORF type:complete len:151 (+),score=10.08 TRINITY_DN2347_c0_g1_i1:129-581(+)
MADASKSAGSKRGIFKYMGHRVTAEIEVGRTIVGTLLGFDRHMNMVLDESEEFRTVFGKRKNAKHTERRHLGLVLLSGRRLKSLSIENDPSPVPVNSERFANVTPEEAAAAAAAPATPAEPVQKKTRQLAAPSRGVGAPDASSMAPTPRQ